MMTSTTTAARHPMLERPCAHCAHCAADGPRAATRAGGANAGEATPLETGARATGDLSGREKPRPSCPNRRPSRSNSRTFAADLVRKTLPPPSLPKLCPCNETLGSLHLKRSFERSKPGPSRPPCPKDDASLGSCGKDNLLNGESPLQALVRRAKAKAFVLEIGT